MKTRGLTEAHALSILREELPEVGSRVAVGIGDDAAVLERSAAKQVWTIDACVEGVHFQRGWLSVEDLAHKSMHAAISDLGAMGARPVAVLVQLTLAPWLTAGLLRRLAREQAAVSRDLGFPIVGGNLTAGPELGFVTTALGHLPGPPLLRSGARRGDELWLVGSVGRARLGLLALERELGRRRLFAPYVAAFRRPQALLREGARLRDRAHACLDVSDGLLRDAPRLSCESAVKVVIERELLARLMGDGFARAARELGVEPVRTLLEGGEDYALLAAGPAARRPRFAKVIGRIEAGRGAWLDTAGRLTRLRGGFEHRSDPRATSGRERRRMK